MDGTSFISWDKIHLSGFRDVDESTMALVKKVIGKHSHRLSELAKSLEEIRLILKPVHEREKSEKYELHAKIVNNGKVITSEVVERNLITAVDAVLNKLIHEIS